MEEIVVHIDTYNIEQKLDQIIENQEILIEQNSGDFYELKNQIQNSSKQASYLICIPITILLIFLFVVRGMK